MKKKIPFFLCMILFNLAANYAHPVTPTLFKMLHFPSSMFGISFALMSAGMFISSPFWGKITGLINSKSAMAIGGIGYGIAQAFFGFGRIPFFIGIARVVAGLSCGAFFVGALTYIANMSHEEERGSYLTMNATIQTVAGAIGYFVGGMLGEVSVYLSFIIQMIQLISTGILVYFVLDEDLEEHDMTLPEVLKASNPFKAFIDGRLFMTKSLALLFTLSTLIFLGYTAVDQSFNYYLKDVFQFTSRYNGMIKGTVGLVSLIFNMTICIYLMKKTDIRKSNIVILFLGMVSVSASLVMKSPLHFIIAIMIFYGFYAIMIPLTQTLITNQAEKKTRNQVLGFYQATKSLGMILGAYIAGMIYSINVMNPFILGAVTFALALILSMIYLRRTIHE